MSQLVNLLGLLHDAHCPRLTGRVDLRDVEYPAPSYAITIASPDGRRPMLRWQGAGPAPQPTETRRVMWFDGFDRIRVEMMRNTELFRIAVRDGDTWWRWDETDGATTGTMKPTAGLHVAPPILDPLMLTPARVLGALQLEPTGVGVRAGRNVVRAQGKLRQSTSNENHHYEFEFDAQYGTILWQATFDDGRAWQTVEAVDISYACAIEAERFTFEAPDGKAPKRVVLPHHVMG